MKLRKFTFLLFGLAASFIILKSDSSGMADVDRTSSGLNSCGDAISCHGSTSGSGNLFILIYNQSGSIVTSYIPGSTYEVNVVLSSNNTSGKAGFQSIAVSNTGLSAGTVSASLMPSKTKVVSIPGKSLVVNNTSDVASITSSGIVTWKYAWTAPSTGLANINFNAIANSANGNGQNTNDTIYTANTLLQQAVTGVEDQFITGLINNTYPNPATNFVNVSLTASQKGIYRVFDLTGKVVSKSTFEGDKIQLNIASLAQGNYILSLDINGKYALTHFSK